MATLQSKFIREVGYHVRASYPFLLVVTDEQDRLVEELEALCEGYLNKDVKGKDKFSVFRWTVTGHWTKGGKAVPRKADSEDGELPSNPNNDFQQISELPECSICVMENLHFFLQKDNPELIQMVKDISRHCQEKNKTVIFANSVLEFPTELEGQITVLEHELPGVDDIHTVMSDIIESVKEKKIVINLTESLRYTTTEALKGMRLGDIENALAYSLVTTKTLDPQTLLAEKCKAIKKAGMLEYVKSTVTFDQIGGLGRLKDWLAQYKISFTDKAKKFNLPVPRGALLLGVPGCGKSMIANAVANMFGIPLIKFDVSSIFSKFVGESEQNIRKAIKIIDAVAPCVLFIDEIEKGISGAGSSGNSGDGGTSPRVFGQLLQWLNDHTSPVFVVGTSNNLDAIPVEFTRKGRFDEIFFVDIPTNGERREIFRVQMLRQKLNPDSYDLNALVEKSPQFTGAEIASGIGFAKLVAANRGEMPNTEDVVKCLEGTIPEAKKNKQRIETIRARAGTLAVPSSYPEKETPKELEVGGKQFRSIQV